MKEIRITEDMMFGENFWKLDVVLDDNQSQKQELLISEHGRCVLRMYRDGQKLKCMICTYGKDTPLRMEGKLNEGQTLVSLYWKHSLTELYIDGRLADEEWPIGECIRGNSVIVKTSGEIKLSGLSVVSEENRKEESTGTELTAIQYWKPEGCNVGDCMPFFDGEEFHVYYLKDRHEHNSKWGLGAHQFAHISSKDLKNWKNWPLAIGITHQWEGSICTGSVIKVGNRYYAFYAVRMIDGTDARISWAVSEDGINF